jgi:hypothetical protein
MTRPFTVLAISCALASVTCVAHPLEDQSNMSCVKRLQLPLYPSIAQSARITVAFTAAIVVANDGSAQSTSFEGVSGPRPDLAKLFFFPEVERSLKGSEFDVTCNGRTVRMAFDFRMDRNPPNLAVFGFPNRFEIWGTYPTDQGIVRTIPKP